jgi:myo-inositol-1(or 4)-monophosphatase
VALEAARAGARLLADAGLPRPGGPASLKAKGDYVTESDRQSEAAIVEVLARRAPGIAILAEEAGGARQGTRWAVDPLDGTTNFIRGFPIVGVAVALLDAGLPVLGVVIAPFLGLELAAARGRGLTMNGESLPRLGPGDPQRAVVATGFPFRNKRRWPRHQGVFEAAFQRFEDVRRAGAASLDLAWTASGTFDGFFELNLGTWDVAAGAALVLEAGGRVSDWEGGDGWVESGDIIAARPAVHEALLELAAKAPQG